MLRRDDDVNDDTTSLQVLIKARYTEEKQKDANGLSPLNLDVKRQRSMSQVRKGVGSAW